MGLFDRSSLLCAAAVAAFGMMFITSGCARKNAPRLALLDPATVDAGGAKVLPIAATAFPAVPPALPPAPAAADRDVRVMSFNCRVSTLFDLHNTWGLRKRLLLDTIENFNPDLLGTQECVWSQYDYLRDRLEGYEAIGVGRDDGKRDGEMCAVFFRSDKFERLDSGHFWLSEDPSDPGSKAWGAWFPRMVTWVKLRPRDGRSQTFCWFNTHLDAFSARARENAAKLLRQRMASIAGAMPVVVTGDFNTDAGTEPYRTLIAGGRTALTDTFNAVHNAIRKEGDGTRHAFRGGRGGPRIDWILASSRAFDTIDADINHTRSGLMYPSDHFPVTAVLRPAAAPTLAQIE